MLHQLTKALFEFRKEAFEKHLTFKTVFVLPQGTAKCSSKIHAWLDKTSKIRQTGPRCICTYFSPSFLSKNQWANEDPECVVLAVIPARGSGIITQG